MKTIGLFFITVWAGVFTLVWIPIVSLMFLVPALFGPVPRWMDRVHRILSSGLLWATGVRVEVTGREHLNPTEPSIVMANHKSLLDIPVLANHLPRLRFVAKRSLGFIPLFGWAMVRSEHVLINRTNRKEAVRTLHRTAAYFAGQKEGRNIVVFPEGTRSRTAELLPFKKGGFHLAYDLGFPLQPVSIQGMERIFPKGAKLLHPGKVRMVIHPRISVDGLERAEVLALWERVRQALDN